jgi:hypothetical protein
MISQASWGSRFTRSRRVRVRAALTALAFLTASWLGVVHEATTVHVRCAAHGELVDSDAPVGAVAAVGAVARSARDAMAPAVPLARGHGDDHCLLASALRESRAVPLAPALAAAAVTACDLVMIAPPAIPAVATSLYRIAPKTSPPA